MHEITPAPNNAISTPTVVTTGRRQTTPRRAMAEPVITERAPNHFK